MHPVAWAGIIWFLLILFVLELDPYRYASMLVIQSTIWNFWKRDMKLATTKRGDAAGQPKGPGAGIEKPYRKDGALSQ